MVIKFKSQILLSVVHLVVILGLQNVAPKKMLSESKTWPNIDTNFAYIVESGLECEFTIECYPFCLSIGPPPSGFYWKAACIQPYCHCLRRHIPQSVRKIRSKMDRPETRYPSVEIF